MAFVRSSALALAAMLLLAVGPALAAPITTPYPDYAGPGMTFTGMQETTNDGDPSPLWGAPTGSGNQLLFFPPSFRASSLNGSPNPDDAVGSNFQATITSNTINDVITAINITEFGDIQIPIASGATGTFASLSVFVTVLADINGAITPVQVNGVGIFTPGDYVTAQGTTLWSATASIDLSGLNATQVQIAIDNDLYAFSEAGTSAAIQKKAVSGPAVIIDVVPEPGTAVLLGMGLVYLGTRRSPRKRAA